MSVSAQSNLLSRKLRAGEFATRFPERSKRFFVEDGFWFFRTREGEAVGPYSTKDNAQKAARTFGRFCRSVHDDQLRLLIHQQLERLSSMSEEQRALPLREGEMDVPTERGCRVLSKGKDWYFRTREGELVGPYEDRALAEDSAETFTQFAVSVSNKQIHHLIATMNGSGD